jgi:uncharacterized protein
MTRPGVYVTEAPLPSVVSPVAPTNSYGAFIGTALRGPTDPVLIRSWTDFVATFGSYSTNTSLPSALHQFFANSGSEAYVCRVFPSSAVQASATFTIGVSDRLIFTTVTAGNWGNAISYRVLNVMVNSASPLKSTFDIELAEDTRGARVVRERFINLSMDPLNSRYVVNIVNSFAIGSSLVTVEDPLKNGVALSTGQAVPEYFINGSDGNPDDLGSSDLIAAFHRFDSIDALLVFNVPGRTDISGLIQLVEDRGDSVLVMDTAENTPAANIISGAVTLPTSSYLAIYYPWIYIADPNPDAPRGAIMKVPPGPAAAGMILRSDASRGVYKAPAGVGSWLAGAVASEYRLDNTALDGLSAANINVIRPVPGSGITVMGARTRSGDSAKYLSIRRTINYVKKQAAQASRFALFEPNTAALWDQLRVANGSFLSELWQTGGLAGRDPSQGYYVKCDADINTPQTIANGEVHVEIGIAPVYPAEFILIRVGQFEADASIVITEEV